MTHSDTQDDDAPSAPRSTGKLIGFGALLVFWFVAFCVLGTWQVHRLSWKRNLIATVDRRIHATPVAPPGRSHWSPQEVAGLTYLHVRVRGTFLNDRETLTQAVSDQGPGLWVMTPLRTDQGFILLINRGFVPDDHRQAATRREGQPQGEVTVTGLIRLSEPKGGFLQSNKPASDEWHSRDVAAIAAKRGLSDVAPYFVDADATPNPGGWPFGGQTIVSFPNNHLQYAITWYGLAVLMLVGGVLLVRGERAARRSAPQAE